MLNSTDILNHGWCGIVGRGNIGKFPEKLVKISINTKISMIFPKKYRNFRPPIIGDIPIIGDEYHVKVGR